MRGKFWRIFEGAGGCLTRRKIPANTTLPIIEGMKIEEVNKTKYLGTTVTKDNLIEEEIKELQLAIKLPSRTKRYSKVN